MLKAIATRTTSPNDPIIVLLAQHESLVERLVNGNGSDEDTIIHGMASIDERLAIAKATSVEGALAALHRLKSELQEFVFESMPEAQSQLYQGLIESVESYLQQQASDTAI